jgi:diguanylate cyclase (GGDEF)-like protein
VSAQLENERYIIFLRYGVWAGLVAHILFILLFLLLGSDILAAFNILSVSIFAVCIRLVARRFITAALLLVTLEIIAHAWLAVWILGWSSGFHYYMITLMMISAFHPQWPMRGKLAYSIFACFAYLLLNQWSLGRAPTIEIGTFALDMVRWFNTIFTFAFVSYLAHYYAKAAREAESKLEQLASTDTLTGLYTRRQMQDVFGQEQSKLHRNPRPLSIIMVDIDDFKTLNDQCGHECGDEALKAIAGCFKNALRSHDHVARWGGEEFLILLPETDLKSARLIAEKVRELAGRVPVASRGQIRHVTITLAVGELLPDEGFDRCVSRIDQGLLAGKRAGKNRVVAV